MAAARRTENIFIFQTLLVKCMFSWPFGLRRQGFSRKTSDDFMLLHQGLRGNTIAMHPPKNKILSKKPLASIEIRAAIEAIKSKITPTVQCH